MKTFWTICAVLALTFGGLVGEVRAQNLAGTWVSPDGAEYKITYNGKQIHSTFWGGPNLPKLFGLNTLTGGPTNFTGTWQSQDGASRGSGSITYTVVNANEFTSVTQGIISVGDNRMPITITVRWTRKDSPGEPEPSPGPNPGPAPELPLPPGPGPAPAPEPEL